MLVDCILFQFKPGNNEDKTYLYLKKLPNGKVMSLMSYLI